MRWILAIAAVPLSFAGLACGAGGTPALASEEPSASIGIPNERRLGDELIVGGRPDEGALRRAADLGVGTVIDLRSPDEPGYAAERALADELGLRFVAIPVAGATGLTEDNAESLDRALSEAEGPVLLHCASGNRVGALLALRAFHVGGTAAEEALVSGRRAGLTGLEPAVREHFERWCAAQGEAPRCQRP